MAEVAEVDLSSQDFWHARVTLEHNWNLEVACAQEPMVRISQASAVSTLGSLYMH
jgi:hypothetical protein